LWEEGAKVPEGKSSWKELKPNFETFEMLLPGILEKEVKIFLVRKGDPQYKHKHSSYYLMDRRPHHELTYYDHGNVTV
jgi:hypothetical protein